FIPATLHALLGADGQTTYSGVWGKSRDAVPSQIYWAQTEPAYERNVRERTNAALFDVDLGRAPEPPGPRERVAADLQAAGATVQEKPDDLQARFNRARANFRLGEYRKAVDDLTINIAKAPNSAAAYRYRALANARL